MNAKVILLVAAGCIVFGIGMGVREMSADIWVRAAIAERALVWGWLLLELATGCGRKNGANKTEL